jgi:alkaline phosphatase D
MAMTRRQAMKSAAAFGAALAWPSVLFSRPKLAWSERRDLYPQGVASGDPHPDSVILWTRRPPSPAAADNRAGELQVEVAEDPGFSLEKLGSSTARWTLWGNSVGMLDWRTDLQNLPADAGPRWPGAGYALMGGDDWSGYRTERAEILDAVRRAKLAGFATLAGDRHAFAAGLLSKGLPPESFEPVGVEFITGSVSAPGLFEAAEHNLKDHPLRALYLHDAPSSARLESAAPPSARLEPAINLTLLRGVRASLALARTHDRRQALLASNPEVAPHLSFTDLGGHGYAAVRASGDELEVEFVCVERPLERSARPDGGPLAYRVVHRVRRWSDGATPKLERTRVEGELPLVL